MPGSAVALDNLSFRYKGEDRGSLAITQLRIEAGEKVALIGASGAGKSTLLRLLDGRLRAFRGHAKVLGRTLDPARTPSRAWRCNTGFVFQEFALVERESVRQNVLNGRLGRTHPWQSLLGRFSEDDHDAVERAMGDVGIDDLAGKRVDRLSGGQRQRVAIARCLAQDPALLLADEPISNLDPVTAQAVLALLHDCAARRGVTLLVSSHQPRLVARYVGRFIALDQGHVVFDGPPEALRDDTLTDIYEEAGPVPEPVS
ncbi:Phosphonates import ATP-binding protein PhnC 1 [Bosea sp. LC85]|uniref:phosphonate ABC transporter ATP-binding protein n=1 Tax=Bosea sp. LC85 TaxID=1502851 RepID=UPI0004E2E0D3|nr:ATP-binding cassette domain-containing protein [Bosea sp. LC85]KFC63759.1 Phosphonates import ATP-binding protein PhnC 1 [Bosea sp. LC85]